MMWPLWKTVQWFLKNLKTELPCDPVILPVGIYPKQLKEGSQRDICTPMLAVLFTTAKKWSQPECPLKDEWINTMWYIHTVDYYSALQRKNILTHATE